MRLFLVALVILATAVRGEAQTFSNSGGALLDDGTSTDFHIQVSGLASNTLDTVSFGLETVCLDIQHDRIADLDIRLIAPDGTSILLTTNHGWDTDYYTGTCFSTTSAVTIADAMPPFTGTFFPDGAMGSVNNGQNGNGQWTLRVLDLYAFDATGTLNSASITFGSTPATYFHLYSTDLPILVINTNGQAIPNEPKVEATMGLVDNWPQSLNHPEDPFNGYEGLIGIEIRGNSSQQFLKKSYGFELWDTASNDVSAALLGMPAESDWVLIANHSDKSLLNNALTFDLAQRMGHYAPRWRNVEVILNGDYVGVYLLTEKVKRDGDRVDIANLQPQDTIGDELTGGYIVKIDWAQGDNSGLWVSDFAPPGGTNGQTIKFLYDYPGNPLPVQRAYIEAYVDSFEHALAGPDFADPTIGFRSYLNERSAIDFFLLNELGRNVDGYRQSTFLHKDKDSNGGKLHLGPVWDFDIAFHNSNYCEGSTVEGWDHLFADYCPDNQNLPPFWWGRLLEDATFADSLRCRWEALRLDVLSPERLDAWCDSMAASLATGQQHNFARWHILGSWVWPNPQPVPTSYTGEIQELKDWIHARWQWMDNNLPGHCSTVGLTVNADLRSATVFPDPFEAHFTLRMPGKTGIRQVHLIDAMGRMNALAVPTGASGSLEFHVPDHLSNGRYSLRVVTDNGLVVLPVLRMAR